MQIFSLLIPVSKHQRNAHNVLLVCHGKLITLECFDRSRHPYECGFLTVNVSSNNSVDLLFLR